MHIPDAYLSPATQGTMFVVMAPLWFVAAKRTRAELTTKQTPLLSMGAAFCFAIQMFNIPTVGGTTAHALGAGLLAILVGPWAALLGMTLTLSIQALLFGDGGILSLGANCWDMAFLAPFVSFSIYRLLSGRSEGGSARQLVSAGIGAYMGTVTAALSAGILLGIQPVIAHNAAGQALYCPFGLNVSVPAMVISHLLVAAPAEAIITVSALAYLWRSFPELLIARTRTKIGQSFRLARAMLWVLVLTPIGLLAAGDAFGEWDLESLKKLVGYAPAGMAHAHDLVKPLLPDYGFAGLQGRTWAVIGYVASAIIGCTLVALFTRGVMRRAAAAALPLEVPSRPVREIPAWLLKPNPATSVTSNAKSPWLANTVAKLRSTVAAAIGSEETARVTGFLQSLNPLAKTIGFLCGLLICALVRTPAPLVLLVATVLAAAWASRVAFGGFVSKVVGMVLFFGLVFAVPVSLRAVTPGSGGFLVFSGAGLNMAALILLRLTVGISLALLWRQTTRWFELIRSLRMFGVSSTFLITATLTYRYLFVMVETLADMVEARTARQVGAASKRQGRAYAGAGTAVLFAKSMAFTEEMHWAMIARSGTGAARQVAQPWTIRDSVFVALTVFGLGIAMVTHAF